MWNWTPGWDCLHRWLFRAGLTPLLCDYNQQGVTVSDNPRDLDNPNMCRTWHVLVTGCVVVEMISMELGQVGPVCFGIV